MKVLALGGSGGMGRYAVETALTFDGTEQIIVGSLNLKGWIRVNLLKACKRH